MRECRGEVSAWEGGGARAVGACLVGFPCFSLLAVRMPSQGSNIFRVGCARAGERRENGERARTNLLGRDNVLRHLASKHTRVRTRGEGMTARGGGSRGQNLVMSAEIFRCKTGVISFSK